MHVHLPKPLHGWRAFIGEVGIIVLGVLIALGAEQVAEHFHEKAQLKEAEDAMVAELRDDDLPQAYARVAIHDCLVNQLDQIENAVVAGTDRGKISSLATAYRPLYRTWDDQAWKAALASQAFASSGSNRMISWSRRYVAIPVLAEAAAHEQTELPQLWARMGGSGPLTTSEKDRLFQAIAILRRDNRQMGGAALYLIKETEDAGIALSRKERSQLLADARQNYGHCVREPSASEVPASEGQFVTSNLRSYSRCICFNVLTSDLGRKWPVRFRDKQSRS